MKGILSKIKPVCFILVLIFMAWGIYSLRSQLCSALQGANWLYLTGAGTISIVYLILNASVWGLIVRLVGEKPPRIKAAFLWIECEAMRWLPGGIWGYASRVIEAKRIGLNKTTGGLSLLLELILTVTAWAILGVLGAALSPRLRSVSLSYIEKLQFPSITLFIVFGAAIAGLLAIITFNLWGTRDKLMSATSQVRVGLLNWQVSLRALGEYLILSLFYSLGFLLCLKGIGVDPAPNLLEACGSYGLAWIVGFLAFGAPGGMGVREGFIFLVFAPLGIGPEVAAAAILWRVIQILTELSLLVITRVKKLAP